MCPDCRQIADEYQELLTARTRALYSANEERDRAIEAAKREKRRADDLDAILRIGLDPLILAWMDSQTSADLRSAVGVRCYVHDPAASADPVAALSVVLGNEIMENQ
jgi:hypothetical protein